MEGNHWSQQSKQEKQSALLPKQLLLPSLPSSVAPACRMILCKSLLLLILGMKRQGSRIVKYQRYKEIKSETQAPNLSHFTGLQTLSVWRITTPPATIWVAVTDTDGTGKSEATAISQTEGHFFRTSLTQQPCSQHGEQTSPAAQSAARLTKRFLSILFQPSPPLPFHPSPPPWQFASCSTLVHAWLLFATGEGTGVGNTGRGWWPVGAPLRGHMTSLSQEVVEGVAQIGNVMLVEGPVLLFCLSETLHQLCRWGNTRS